MTYEERKRIIAIWLKKLLTRYEVPAHLNENGLREEMILMVEDINSECPMLNEGGFNFLLEKVAQYVRKNHTSRRWPTTKLLVGGVLHHRESMTDEHRPAQEAIEQDNDDNLDFHDYMIIKKVKNGGDIAGWLLENGSTTRERLIASGKVTEKDFDKYRPPHLRLG